MVKTRRYSIIIALIVSIASIFFYKQYTQAPSLGLSHYILDQQNKPTKSLATLLNVLEISHDNTLKTIIPETQKAWRQQA